jgi:hypothetical protein
MSNITELAAGQLNTADTITIELVEADETPAVVIIKWPNKATVLHPRRFGAAADTAARVFAGAVVKLAQIRRSGSCEPTNTDTSERNHQPMSELSGDKEYPQRLPEAIPAGQVLVHNDVYPFAKRQGNRGSRYWLQ